MRRTTPLPISARVDVRPWRTPSPCSGRFGTTPTTSHAALAAYAQARVERAGDLVLRARKRCDLMHAKDPAATEAWYSDLRNEDGTNVIRGIVGNILGGPLTPQS